MKTLGVIGGLGPMASAYFLERIIEMTDVQTDQEHLDVILFSRPNVPDRTAYLLDNTLPSPAASIAETAKTLQSLGACCLAIPCVTAHALLSQIGESINIPIINMVRETASCLSKEGMKKTGILATTGTVKTELFQKALSEIGIEATLPSSEMQQLVMDIIYKNIKSGIPPDMENFHKVSNSLFDAGCDSIILGCTELSVIRQTQNSVDLGFIDTLDVLASQSIIHCEKPLKPTYETLIKRRQ